MVLKSYSPYVRGIVGADFKLTLGQRLRLLFCKKLSVIFIEKWREKRKGVAE